MSCNTCKFCRYFKTAVCRLALQSFGDYKNDLHVCSMNILNYINTLRIIKHSKHRLCLTYSVWLSSLSLELLSAKVQLLNLLSFLLVLWVWSPHVITFFCSRQIKEIAEKAPVQLIVLMRAPFQFKGSSKACQWEQSFYYCISLYYNICADEDL